MPGRLAVCWLALGAAWAATLPLQATAQAAAPASAPTLVLGAEDAAAPWSYADGSGYVNDLVRAVFAEAGWTLQLKVMPYARCKAQAMAGTLAGCFSASRLPALEATLLYPGTPVFQATNVLLVRADSPWRGCGVAGWARPPVIGLVRGYEYLPAVEQLLASGAARAERASSESVNLRKLSAGRIDAALLTLDEVKRLDDVLRRAGLPDTYRTACEFGALPAFVAFSRAHPQGHAALAAYEAAQARLQRRGAVAALQAQWRQRTLGAPAARAEPK
jgi:ABC-type amino acid transport substrate-binding protein